MATPIKPNIATKSNFVSRPSVPSSQKHSAADFNQIVAAIRANYERLILRWATDIVVNTTLPAGQYVVYTDEIIYRVHTAFSVGDPLTWDASKVTAIGGTGGGAGWELSGLTTLLGGTEVSADGNPLGFTNITEAVLETLQLVLEINGDIGTTDQVLGSDGLGNVIWKDQTGGLSSSNFVVRETPTGSVNSSNTVYNLANVPVAGTEEVYLNGILQEPGGGNDYTISSATITFLTAPTTGDRIRVSYRK